MEPTELTEIARIVGGRLEGEDAGVRATGAKIDSRAVEPGDLFFALPGKHAHGADFAGAAVRNGAAAVVAAHDDGLALRDLPDARRLRVADPAAALQDLARAYRRTLAMPVVAVTGSCGKTSTREMIHAVLTAHLGPGIRSRASYNNHLGVPLTLLEAERRHAFAVVEMGANGPGEIRALSRLAAPRVGVITNVRKAHLEGFQDLFGVARAKGEIFEELPPDGLAVFNPAEFGLSTLAVRRETARLTFGAGRGCSARIEAVETAPGGIAVTINGTAFEVPVLGKRLAWNVAAAAAVGIAFGMDLPEAAEALRDFRSLPGRLHRTQAGPVTLIDDAYNANPASMKAALDALPATGIAGRRVLVLGDMLELGRSSLSCHMELGREASKTGADLVVTVGRYVSATAGALLSRGCPPSRIRHFEDTGSAALEIPGLLREGDVVLLKASRALRFEKIREAIESRFTAPAEMEACLSA